MKTSRSFFMALPVLALAACTSDDAPRVETETLARFSTNLEQRVQTKMHDAEWENGDEIGIFTLNNELRHVVLPGETAPGLNNMRLNMKYAYSPSKGWESADPFYFKDPEASDVYFAAYYPWTALGEGQVTVTEPEGDNPHGKLSGTMPVDASVQSSEAQKKFDILYAQYNSDQPDKVTPFGNKDNPQVKFHFTHSMTKIVIKLQPDRDGGSTGYEDVLPLIPSLKGFKPKGQFDFSNGMVIADAEVNTSGIELSNKIENADDESIAYTVILPPQTTGIGGEAPEISLVSSENSDVYRSAKFLEHKELLNGKCYTVNIIVKKKTLEIASSMITDWVNDPNTEEDDAVLQ